MTTDNDIKRQEADNLWAKEHGYDLERDKCEKCLGYKERGDVFYCSPGHAYEVSNLRQQEAYTQAKVDLFNMVYGWGKSGIEKTAEDPEYMKAINGIEERWY